jgi:hypothetical protein
LAFSWRYSPSTRTPIFSYGGHGVVIAVVRSSMYSSRLLGEILSRACTEFL